MLELFSMPRCGQETTVKDVLDNIPMQIYNPTDYEVDILSLTYSG